MTNYTINSKGILGWNFGTGIDNLIVLYFGHLLFHHEKGILHIINSRIVVYEGILWTGRTTRDKGHRQSFLDCCCSYVWLWDDELDTESCDSTTLL